MAERPETVFTEDIKTAELSRLLDLLASYTAHYTYMMGGGGSRDEFQKYKDAILKLQAEINFRYNKGKQ